MKRLVRNLLVAAVAIVGSMPFHAAKAESHGPCDGHGGMWSASARPAGKGFEMTVGCAGQYDVEV